MVCSFKQYFILLFTLGISAINSFSQDFYLQGKLTDISKKALPYSTVTLLNADSAIVSYSIAGLDGNFKIKILKIGHYILKANSLGYKTFYKDIIFDNKKSIVVNISLEKKTELLEDIFINGGTKGIYQNTDTLIYNSNVFTDGSEKVLGDVLKKLPGVDVDSKGNITVQGKRVEKLLLNGEDFFSNNTQLAVNNLSSDIVKNVEVLSNYNDFPLLKGFRNSNKIVINIKTDSCKTGKLSGSITGGEGFKNKYTTKGNIIGLKSKLMVSSLIASNNTGDEVFSILNFIARQGDFNDLVGEGSNIIINKLSKAESSLLIAKNNTYKRTNTLSSFNVSYHPNSKFKINSYFLWNIKNEINKDFNKYHYFKPFEYSNSQFVSGSTINNLFNAYIKLKYYISKTFTLQSSTTYSNFSNRKNSFYLDIMNIDSIKTNDTSINISSNFKQTLSFIKKISSGVIITNFFLSKNLIPQTLFFNTDSLLLPFNAILKNDLYKIQQENIMGNFVIGGNISYNLKLNNKHFIKTTVFSQLATQNLLSTLNDANIEQKTEKIIDSVTNNSYYKILDVGVKPYLIKNMGFFQYKLGLKFHHYSFNHDLLIPVNDLCLNKLNTDVEVSLHFSSKHIMKLGFTEKDILINIDNLNDGIFIDNYQSYYINSKINQFIKTRYSINFSYQISNLFSNTFFYLISNFSKYKNASSINYKQMDLLSEQQNILSQLNSDFFILSSLSKGLGYTKWKMKVTTEYDLTKSYIQSYSIGQNNIMNNYNGVFEILSDYKKGFNVELKTKQDYIINKSTATVSSFQYLHDYMIKLKYLNGSYFCSSSLTYRINHTTLTSKRFYDLCFNFRYSLNKNINFEISGSNILNLTNQNWIVTSYNGIYNLEKYYWQIPGNILFKLRYRFK